MQNQITYRNRRTVETLGNSSYKVFTITVVTTFCFYITTYISEAILNQDGFHKERNIWNFWNRII